MVLMGLIINKNKQFIDRNLKKQRITTYVLAACLLVSFASEHFFRSGRHHRAYLLGLFLSTHAIKKGSGQKVNVPIISVLCTYIFRQRRP